MEILAGVDGGATKTLAVIGTSEGKLLGCAQSSSSNYHNVGIRKAALSIRGAIRHACGSEGILSRDIGIAVLGLAAMDCPKDFVTGGMIARASRVGRHQIVKHDSTIALYGATLGKPGIVVNAGTGSFAAGVDRHGKIIRAGGWGSIIDDEGSAYDIGRLAIRSALRSIDGRERETALTKLLMREFQVRKLENIVHDIYNKPITVDELSALSQSVAKVALAGDQVARRIFAYEARVLAGLVAAIARRLKMASGKPDVYCIGGVFNTGDILMRSFRRELRRKVPEFTLRSSMFEPVVGAFILALKEAGREMDDRTLTNLAESCTALPLLGQRQVP